MSHFKGPTECHPSCTKPLCLPAERRPGRGGGQQLLPERESEQPRHTPGQGQEVSSASRGTWGPGKEPGDPARNVAAALPALCSLQAKVSFLWEGQGTVLHVQQEPVPAKAGSLSFVTSPRPVMGALRKAVGFWRQDPQLTRATRAPPSTVVDHWESGIISLKGFKLWTRGQFLPAAYFYK